MGPIHVSYDPRHPNTWILDRPYERQTSMGPIVVPQGFKTDLASIPWQVWQTFPPWGPWIGAAIVHDYLYRTKPTGVSRFKADRVFYELMKNDGVLYGVARTFYRLVREFGDRSW